MISLAESASPRLTLEQIVDRAKAFAADRGVSLELDLHDHNTLMLGIWRTGEHGGGGQKGSGAEVMNYVCALADQNEVELMLDVIKSTPRLIEYYGQFGFRGWTEGEDDAQERAEWAAHKAEWDAFVATDPDEDDYIVATMVRPPHAKPVV